MDGFILQDVTQIYRTCKDNVLRVFEMGRTNRITDSLMRKYLTKNDTIGDRKESSEQLLDGANKFTSQEEEIEIEKLRYLLILHAFGFCL